MQPWVHDEDLIIPGSVERQRRALEDDDTEAGAGDDLVGPEYDDVFKISRQKTNHETGLLSEELCMLIRISARFTIMFETKPPSSVQVDEVVVDLPVNPDRVNGTCVSEKEVAKIFVFWSGYNFTLEFIKNPEGNSFYLNRAILQYDTKHPDLYSDFKYSAGQGIMKLETMPGLNFFFTPLGKSFVCSNSEDQGPMKLYNADKNQIQGSMEMWNTKFQPFVVRAGGGWGPEKPCLAAEIRKSRIEFWPFVSAGLLFLCSGVFFGGYAAKRTWFTDQKVDYGSYEEGNQKVQHEMVRQQTLDTAPGYTDVSLQDPGQAHAQQPQQQAANPFQQKSANPFQAASNPFNN